MMDSETKEYFKVQFADLSARIDGVETKLGSRIDRVETSLTLKIGQLETKLSKDIADVAESVGALAAHVDERFAELAPTIARMENHDSRLTYVEKRLTEIARA